MSSCILFSICCSVGWNLAGLDLFYPSVQDTAGDKEVA